MPYARLGYWGAHGIAGDLTSAKRVIRPRDFTELKVPHTWIYFLARRGYFQKLEKVGPGLYVHKGVPVDPLIVLARKYPRVTLGLTSALWLHGLAERPEQEWWVMGIKDRIPTVKLSSSRFVRSSWPQDDRVEVEVDQTKLFVHSVDRALLDCVKFQKQLGEATIAGHVHRALEAKATTVEALRTRSKGLHVHQPLRRLLRRLAAATATGAAPEGAPTAP